MGGVGGGQLAETIRRMVINWERWRPTGEEVEEAGRVEGEGREGVTHQEAR